MYQSPVPRTLNPEEVADKNFVALLLSNDSVRIAASIFKVGLNL